MANPRKPTELRFKIGAYTPATMPMARLAKYMTALADFLGEASMVHFVGLEAGSTVLVERVEKEAVPKVEARISLVKRGDELSDAMKKYRQINEMLREDNGVGFLFRGKKGRLLEFPGIEAAHPTDYGIFAQEGTLDGVPIRVGGKLPVVPVTIQQEDREYICHAKRDFAKQIAGHLFTSTLRLFGRGRWYRDPKGAWVLEHFMIQDFVQLKQAPLSHVVEELRAVEGSEWPIIENPWEELSRLRSGGDSEK
jgi:hypothetical protein